jgi:hypothetical protein
VPGGNRPSSEESEVAGVGGRGIASVNISDAVPNAAPQAKQKRRSGISAEQERHRAIGSHSTMGFGSVVAEVPYNGASFHDPSTTIREK